MDYEFGKPPFLTVSLFAGLFSGFLLAIVNLIYDFIYREITQYAYSQIINVSSIIFLSVLLLIVAGLIYFFCVKFIKRGELLYSLLFIIATILVCITILSHQYAAPYSGGFKYLSFGVIMLTGLFAIAGIPYFVKHNKTFI
jgi:hypothetical protein